MNQIHSRKYFELKEFSIKLIQIEMREFLSEFGKIFEAKISQNSNSFRDKKITQDQSKETF